MYPGRYFLPNYTTPFMSIPYQTPRIGLFSRIGNTIKSVNWSGILNGADRTLGVVNQTIPLVRQAKPMFSNMKSMMKLAKAFRSETSSNIPNTMPNNNYTNKTIDIIKNEKESPAKFFI